MTLRSIGLVLAGVLFSPSAFAQEQNLVKDRGEHPHYFFDAEPHGLVGYGPFVRNLAPGAGFRGTFIIVQNGFIPKLNNSVGIGVGADAYFARGGASFAIPLVLQWNFWVSTHWAVFGEPGLALAFGRKDYIGPTIFGGGRYHFNERVALTLRVGYPSISVGVSFYL